MSSTSRNSARFISRLKAVAMFFGLWLTAVAMIALPTAGYVAPVRIPIRWCQLEGDGPSFLDPAVVGESNLKGVLWRRHERATDKIYLPKANISLRSGATFQQPAFPVITDGTAVGEPGDIVAPCPEDGSGTGLCAGKPGDGGDEFEDILTRCRDAWKMLDASAQGIVAVQVNRFVDANGQETTIGGWGKSGGTLGPRTAVIDVAYTCGENVCPGKPFTLFAPDVFEDGDLQEKLLGHEIGHTLTLGHLSPLSCDTCDNLMQYRFPSDPDPSVDMFGTILTSSQADQMENFACSNIGGVENCPGNPPRLLIDDAIDDVGDAGQFGFADIRAVGAASDPFAAVTRFSASFVEELPDPVFFEVFFFVDTDNDASTGGDPSVLLPPGFSSPGGVELATIVNMLSLEAVVFEFDSGSGQFEEVVAPGITATVAPRLLEGDDFLTGEASSIESGYDLKATVPEGAIGPLGMEVVMEVRAIAPQPDGGAIDLDRVRKPLFFGPPVFPTCAVKPSVAIRGSQVVIKAFDLPPDRPIHAYLGDAEVVSGSFSDFQGSAELEFTVALDARLGTRLVTVGIDDEVTAITADCELTLVANVGDLIDQFVDDTDDGLEGLRDVKRRLFDALHAAVKSDADEAQRQLTQARADKAAVEELVADLVIQAEQIAAALAEEGFDRKLQQIKRALRKTSKALVVTNRRIDAALAKLPDDFIGTKNKTVAAATSCAWAKIHLTKAGLLMSKIGNRRNGSAH